MSRGKGTQLLSQLIKPANEVQEAPPGWQWHRGDCPRVSAAKKPVSPYSGYNGQLLTSVYQPTEMALMHKGTVSVTPGVATSCQEERVWRTERVWVGASRVSQWLL